MADYEERSAATTGKESLSRVTANILEPRSPIECGSLKDLQDHLRQLLRNSSLAFIPPLVTTSLYLSPNAKFEITSTPSTGSEVESSQAASTDGATVGAARSNQAEEMSTVQILGETKDSKARIKLQHVVARQIVNAIKEVDGFRYGVRNEFESKKDGHRYTFACHDSVRSKQRKRSTKNRDRSQEGLRPVAAQALQRLNPFPSYDCGGEIIVRFQRTWSRIEVVYAHMAIHRKVALRRARKRSETVQRQAVPPCAIPQRLPPGYDPPSVGKETQASISQHQHNLVSDQASQLLDGQQQTWVDQQAMSRDVASHANTKSLQIQSRAADSGSGIPVPPDLAARIQLLRTPTQNQDSRFGVLIPPALGSHSKVVESRLINAGGNQPITSFSFWQEQPMEAQRRDRYSLGNEALPDTSTNSVSGSSEGVQPLSAGVPLPGRGQQTDSRLPSIAEEQHSNQSQSNPAFTSNGTPRQEGVFEHRPNGSYPVRPAKSP